MMVTDENGNPFVIDVDGEEDELMMRRPVRDREEERPGAGALLTPDELTGVDIETVQEGHGLGSAASAGMTVPDPNTLPDPSTLHVKREVAPMCICMNAALPIVV